MEQQNEKLFVNCYGFLTGKFYKNFVEDSMKNENELKKYSFRMRENKI